MGVICCFGEASPEKFPSKDANDLKSALLTSANTVTIKQRCSQRKNGIKKTELNLQEKQRQKQKQQAEKDEEFITLKDRLLSSPALNTYCSNNSSGEDQQSLHCPVLLKQNKVYPSFAADNYTSNPRSSFSKQRLLMAGEVDSSSRHGGNVSSSLRGSRSKKSKKRVSFKLPEEADIIIYNISEEGI